MSKTINNKWIDITEKVKQPKKALEVTIKLCESPGLGCTYERDYKVYDAARIVAQRVCDYDGCVHKDIKPACGYKGETE